MIYNPNPTRYELVYAAHVDCWFIERYVRRYRSESERQYTDILRKPKWLHVLFLGES